MKVDYKNDKYRDTAPLWRICRDAYSGQQAIHKEGTQYLPKLSGQNSEQYNAYLSRALFYNATRKTIDGLTGLIFRRYPITTAPTSMDDILADVTMSTDATQSLDVVAMEVVKEVLTVGQYGLLVEYPQAQQIQTMAQARALNLRPYISTYKAESIINWRYQRINNSLKLTLVVLHESVEDYKDTFEKELVSQYRVLTLENNVYTQRVFAKNERGDFIQLGDDIVPLMNGAPLDYIPFIGINQNGVGIDPTEPPLLDLINTNISHYKTTADLEHGAHFCGLPTAVISGYQKEEGEVFAIGSENAWVFADPTASASYLEFKGDGLATLSGLQESKELKMATLGAGLISESKKVQESEDAFKIRVAGQTASLSTIAKAASIGITRALEILAQWAGVEAVVDYELNSDFVGAKMTSQELTALTQALQSGAISEQVFFHNIKNGGLTPETHTLEDEQQLKLDQGPQLVQDSEPSSLIETLRARVGL